MRNAPEIKKWFYILAAICMVTVITIPAPAADNINPGMDPEYSAHKAQEDELDGQPEIISDDQLEAEALEATGTLFPRRIKPRSTNSAEPAIDKDFIVFGYLQSESVLYYVRWNAITHIGSLFVNFDSSGNFSNLSTFTNRSSYLRAGGAAEAAGVKVVIVVRNASFNTSIINTVMTSPSLRTTLINNIVNAVTTDSYCQGVSFDFESFSWTSSARDGMTQFFADLRSALPAQYEISMYADPTPSTTQFDVAGFAPNLDYITYSMYDWGWANTPHAISDFNSCLPSMRFYLNNGLPPEKFVITISSYGRRWDSTGYDIPGANRVSRGFTDGQYDTTLNPNYGGPYTNNYVRGDEGNWYTWNDGTNRVITWDSPESMEYKIRHALSFQDSTGVWNGRRLGGVGFWSLYWLTEQSSWDPRTSSSASKPRTYPHIYQLCEEILSSPGDKRYLIEGFEGLDYRWRDPNESPDTVGDTDNDSTRALAASPGGTGAPENTTNAMQVVFDFEESGSNQAMFAHEVLNSPEATSVTDINSVAGIFDSTTSLFADIYTSAAYPGAQVRMLVIDEDLELEISDPFTLNASGWRQIEWDITDPGSVNAYTTGEPAFSSGDGLIDTAGGGALDIGFYGFLIEATGPVAGNVIIDEISFEHSNPGGGDYVINEFRYAGSDSEFVEIYGPAGALPDGFRLRRISAADGTSSSVPLSGTIIDSGDGFGFFVIGDPSVSNVDYSTGFGDAADDLSDADPSGLQLYNSVTGGVYDSVVYEAWGGLDDLIRMQTLGVTANGYPWLGGIEAGTNSGGDKYTMGRYPDGNNTNMNFDDFSFINATPGAANDTGLSLPAAYSFNSAPTAAFSTAGTFDVTDPVAAGLPASAGGGLAHRCVNTAGGGAMSVIGGPSLGAFDTGYNVSGEIYLPNSAAAAQAIGVGICGKMGSTFFSGNPDDSGYESGYWLIYENTAGVGTYDGQVDHPGVFHFVYATNDNMDGEITELLGSASRASLSAPDGGWTTFNLLVDPSADSSERLVAQINGFTVFSGDIPDGGPTSGAFQAGFRENHSGAPAASEGTWIDSLYITGADPVAPEFAADYRNIPCDSKVILEWDAADAGGAPITYNVYCSSSSGGQNFDTPCLSTTDTFCELDGLTNGTPEYVVIRAEAVGGLETDNTNEIVCVPGTNMISGSVYNNDFEYVSGARAPVAGKPEAWSASNQDYGDKTTAFYVDDTDPYEGSYCALMETTGAPVNPNDLSIAALTSDISIPLQKNRTYAVSAAVRRSHGQWTRFILFSAGFSLIHTESFDALDDLDGDTGWQKMSFHFRAPIALDQVYLRIDSVVTNDRTAGGGACRMWVDDMQIVELPEVEVYTDIYNVTPPPPQYGIRNRYFDLGTETEVTTLGGTVYTAAAMPKRWSIALAKDTGSNNAAGYPDWGQETPALADASGTAGFVRAKAADTSAPAWPAITPDGVNINNVENNGQRHILTFDYGAAGNTLPMLRAFMIRSDFSHHASLFVAPSIAVPGNKMWPLTLQYSPDFGDDLILVRFDNVTIDPSSGGVHTDETTIYIDNVLIGLTE